MLNYPFPYDSAVVSARFIKYRDALQRALSAAGGPDAEQRVSEYLAARVRLLEALSEVAAEQHEPLLTF